MSSTAKRILLIVGVVLGVLVILILVGAYNVGLFNRVELQQTTRGPYQIVYLAHTGPYYQIGEKIKQVSTMLQEKNVRTLRACGIFYDDPRTVPQDQLRSKGGFLVEGQVIVEAPYGIDSIAQREVILATVKAHPAVAPLKTYPKMHEWMTQNHYEVVGPGLEIYREGGVIECELPIQPRKL
jgi:effector-binding domain-containing protein